MQLPGDLDTALTAVLRDVPSRALARAGSEISTRYREGYGRAGDPFLQSELDVIAYAAYRFPATYGAIAAVFHEVNERRPDLDPTTLLDVGGGLGTAAWAAVTKWPRLERATILERDRRMIEVGRVLAKRSDSAVIRSLEWPQADVTAPWECRPADVTVAAYVMGEIPEETHIDVVHRLWDCTAETCVVIEPGTPRGYGVIRQVGDKLASMGAHVLAPFPPGWECLESAQDWCHFSQRIPRTRMLRAIKGGKLPYEDEKYSYVVASRTRGIPIAARVIRHPQARSGHVRLVLCTPEGVKHLVVSRRDGEAYRRARDLRWGSAISPEEAGLFGLKCVDSPPP